MEIKTKYDIGQTVFYIKGNKVFSGKIDMVIIRKESIKYCSIGNFTLKEEWCYSSKEELIKSL